MLELSRMIALESDLPKVGEFTSLGRYVGMYSLRGKPYGICLFQILPELITYSAAESLANASNCFIPTKREAMMIKKALPGVLEEHLLGKGVTNIWCKRKDSNPDKPNRHRRCAVILVTRFGIESGV